MELLDSRIENAGDLPYLRRMHLKLRNFLILFLLILSGSLCLNAQTVYFPQIGDGTVGNLRFQTTIVLVNTGPAVTVELAFFKTGAGDPFELTLGDLGTDSTFSIDLPQGGSVSLQTSGTGTIGAGYARVTDPRNSMNSLLGGTAVFTRSEVDTGILLYEAGVPATSSLSTFTLFVDTLGNLDTGLALVNVQNSLAAAGQAQEPEISLSLRDTDFQDIANTVIHLAAGAHTAQYIGQYFDQVPEANEMQGTLVVESSQAPLAAVTLRQNDIPGVDFPNEVPTLTTFPVVPGAVGAALTGSFAALDSDRLSVTFRIPNLEWAREIQMRFMRGDQELASFNRSVLPNETWSDVFVLPGQSRLVSRIEVEVMGTGGNQRRYSLSR